MVCDFNLEVIEDTTQFGFKYGGYIQFKKHGIYLSNSISDLTPADGDYLVFITKRFSGNVWVRYMGEWDRVTDLPAELRTWMLINGY